jgi:hypothetical protein
LAAALAGAAFTGAALAAAFAGALAAAAGFLAGAFIRDVLQFVFVASWRQGDSFRAQVRGDLFAASAVLCGEVLTHTMADSSPVSSIMFARHIAYKRIFSMTAIGFFDR